MDYYRLTLKIPKQPWRWLRFRLLTILLIVTIVCLCLGWYRDHQRQQQLIYTLQNPAPHWGTDEVTGPPDTDSYGDQRTAWASRSADATEEWLILEYTEPVVAEEVRIHENYKPGAVVKITRLGLSNRETTLWKGTDPTPPSAEGGTSQISVSAAEPIKRIKVYIDSPAVPGWNEIDAVGLVDTEGNVHWAAKAWASSSYGRNNEWPSGLSGMMSGVYFQR